MIKENDLYGFKHYYYGEAYYGSDEGMRFRLAREPLKNIVFLKEEERYADDPVLKADVWFGSLAYDKTPHEEITSKAFDFDPTGYKEAVAWLNSMKEKAHS
ncbi:MAG: hypothetical protein K6G03_03015 [Lachnospiraceae bacterium]|nr:hypothetical protein [Lachnospiraceae bacterium]